MSAAEVMRTAFPDDDFWKSSTRTSYTSAAKQLLAAGFSTLDAASLLAELYYAASEEFGA